MQSASHSAPLPRWFYWLSALLVCLAVAAITISRKPDALFDARFFAEDALVFFNDDRKHAWAAFLVPSAGYYHFLARFFAALVGRFDPLYAPLGYTLSALFMIEATALVCLLARTGLSFPCRLCMALAVAWVPNGGEVLLVLTNIQWVFGPALLLLILQEPPKRVSVGVFCLLLIAAGGLTGPFLAIFLPALFVKIIAERDFSWYRLSALAIGFGAAVVQVGGLLGRDSAKIVAPFERWPVAIAEHVLAASFWGPGMLLDPQVFAWVYIVVVAAGFAAIIWAALRARLPLILYLLFGAALMFGAGYAVLRDAPENLDPFIAGRYIYPPTMIFLWVLIIYAFAYARSRIGQVIAAVCVLSICATTITHFQTRLEPYDWSTVYQHYLAENNPIIPIDPPGWRFAIAPRIPRW